MFQLYVVGESSSDPDDWSEWSERAFVAARSPAEALANAGAPEDAPVALIVFTRPIVLARITVREDL